MCVLRDIWEYLWGPSKLVKEVDKLRTSFKSASKRVRALMEDNDVLRKAYQEQVRMLLEMCNWSGGYLWRKDAEGRYLYASASFCTQFFGLGKCSDIVGYTDEELIAAYRQCTNEAHTFAKICALSDAHVMAAKVPEVFLEMGAIGEIDVVLKVRKTPLYGAENKFIGTIGFALGMDDCCTDMVEDVQRSVTTGSAEELHSGLYLLHTLPHKCIMHRD